MFFFTFVGISFHIGLCGNFSDICGKKIVTFVVTFFTYVGGFFTFVVDLFYICDQICSIYVRGFTFVGISTFDGLTNTNKPQFHDKNT